MRYNDANGREPGGPGDLVLPSPGFFGTLAAGLETAGTILAAPELIGAGIVGGLIYLGAQSGGSAKPGYMIGNEPIYTNQAQYDRAHPTTSAKDDNGRVSASRGANNRTADPEANADHTVVNGKGTTTYRENSSNPNKNNRGKGFETAERVDKDPSSAGHTNTQTRTRVPTPHRVGSKSNPEAGYQVPGESKNVIPGGVQPVPPSKVPTYNGPDHPGYIPSIFSTSH